MLGAIAGDIIGSCFEGGAAHSYDFELFGINSYITDDTVCTVAVAQALLTNQDVGQALKDWCKKYPNMGYGCKFFDWVHSSRTAGYGSVANGAVMRVSAAGWLGSDLDEAQALAERATTPTHNSDTALLCAKVVAGCIFLLRQGVQAHDVLTWSESQLGESLSDSFSDVLKFGNSYSQNCLDTTKVALGLALKANSWEHCIRSVCVMGGDTDTIGATAGAIAEARFAGVPAFIAKAVFAALMPDMQSVLAEFFRTTHRAPPWLAQDEENDAVVLLKKEPKDFFKKSKELSKSTKPPQNMWRKILLWLRFKA